MTEWRKGKIIIVDDEMVVPDSLNRREALEGGTAGDFDLALPAFSGAEV